MAKYLVLISLAVLYLFCGPTSGSTSPPCGVSLVLVGSSGDLSKRYLWPAIFDNFYRRKDTSCELVVYGSVTKQVVNESQLWLETTVNVDCLKDDIWCRENVNEFRRATHFFQLKFEEHYEKLSVRISEYYAQRDMREVGRIFYLAVPPSAYASICKSIHVHARPTGAWTRIVLEKPFGEDLASAQLLADKLSQFFDEEEIYRVDHYMGKFGVQEILPFREMNDKLLAPLWNKEQISYVEIAMKERLDVAGRSRFYDKYGVIRDVFQNHLTEILVQLAMDLPLNTSDKLSYLKAKSELLSAVYPPHTSQVILGQYMDYQHHLAQDNVPQSPGNVSRTPTHATVLILLGSPKWRHVPFILVSGKQLAQRSAYARVVFKDRSFSLIPKERHCPPEIVFLIQDKELQAPGILVSSHFSDVPFELPFGDTHTWSKETALFPPGGSSDCLFTYLHPSKPVPSNAYVSLLEALLDGRRELFVDTESLIRSWIIWTPLLKEIQLTTPAVYLYSRTALENLDFQLQSSKLVGHEVSLLVEQNTANTCIVQSVKADTRLSAMFQAPAYVFHEYELGSLLAEHVYSAAVHSTRERGTFHLALPGGTSPRPFFQSLVLNYQYLFPWQHTHIWQTDERCLRRNSTESNLHRLSEFLLSLLPILYPLVHEMPVESVEGLCTDDRGMLLYQKQLTEYANNGILDYVVLGLGSDGHVASLFPEAAVSSVHGGPLVNMVTLKESYSVSVKQRLTLSKEAILRARHIGLLITGEQKAKIANKLWHCLAQETDCADLPVVKLIRSVAKEQLTVYIDAHLSSFMDSDINNEGP